jgi:signal transduction histidine kinase/CheY-like chemotaxis protein
MEQFKQNMINSGFLETIRRIEMNPFTLSFKDREKNRQFDDLYYSVKIKPVRIALIVGVIMYVSFYGLDLLLFLDIPPFFFVFRFYVILPLVLVLFLFSYTRYFKKVYQPLLSFAVFTAGAGIIIMTIITKEKVFDTYFVGIILVSFLGYTFIGLRYLWSTATGWLLAFIYLFAAASYGNLNRVVLLNNVIFLFTFNILGMITAYLLEYFIRRDYCFQKMLETSSEKIRQVNEHLEEEVETRTEQLRESYEKLKKEIEEKKQLTEKQESLQKQLIQSQKMEAIGLLAGGIAHDFNNLLTVINGYSELLLLKHKSGKENELLSQIYETGKKAEALTGQLLAFSRKQIMKSVPVDLNQLIKNLEMMFHHLAGENIDIIFVLDKENVKISADPGQLEQVLVNLVINARDAMADGGVIKIATEVVESDELAVENSEESLPPEMVSLTVSDTGIGMDNDVLNHIFEPFYTNKEKGKGTGLGLSTVYGIVKQTGGYIRVSSELGKGTVFKIYFAPYYGDENPENESNPKTDKSKEPDDEITVLLVEDEDSVREFVEYIMKDAGYRVYSASSGKEGYEIFIKHKNDINLLVADVIMPGGSGKELAEKALKIAPHIKCVFISGYTDEVLGKHGVLGDKINLINKPFTREDFLSGITNVLNENGMDL